MGACPFALEHSDIRYLRYRRSNAWRRPQERGRPSYPPCALQLLDHLLPSGPLELLDLGAGTEKWTMELLSLGLAVWSPVEHLGKDDLKEQSAAKGDVNTKLLGSLSTTKLLG